MKMAAKPKKVIRMMGTMVVSLFSGLLLVLLYWLDVAVDCMLCVTVTTDAAPAGSELVVRNIERVRMMRDLLDGESAREAMEESKM